MSKSNFLRQIREDKKVKQHEIAKVAGVERNAIYSFENGRSMMTPDKIQKIAEFLEVTPQDILEGTYIEESINKEEKELHQKAMRMVMDYYPNIINDKDKFVDVTAHLYGFLLKMRSSKLNREAFIKELETRTNIGLAAKCLANSNLKED